MQENIVIRGVRQNNLKGFDLTLPRNKLIVFTGLSGCGKSSLAFDTLYAEGQRRYVESLSSYARQFLGQMEKPDVDAIDGLSPAISIDQKTTSKNPRSTVGTVTEIHDYLRLLYARVGVPHCPKCGREIAKQTVDQMVDQLLALPERTRMQLLAPVVRGKKGEHVKILENVVKQGFVRVRIDGETYDAAEAPALAKQKKHNIEVVVDRLILREDIRTRLTDSLETALSLSGGVVIADIGPGEREMLFSQNLACPDCGISMEELSPRSFSFNSPFGACPTCAGLGMLQKIDPDGKQNGDKGWDTDSLTSASTILSMPRRILQSRPHSSMPPILKENLGQLPRSWTLLSPTAWVLHGNTISCTVPLKALLPVIALIPPRISSPRLRR